MYDVFGMSFSWAHFKMATTLKRIRREAVGAKGEYDCTIESLRDSLRGPGSIKKTEKAILPDGAICVMETTWVPDPVTKHLSNKQTLYSLAAKIGSHAPPPPLKLNSKTSFSTPKMSIFTFQVLPVKKMCHRVQFSLLPRWPPLYFTC